MPPPKSRLPIPGDTGLSWYVCQRDAKEHAGASGLPRLPTAELESAVLDQLRANGIERLVLELRPEPVEQQGEALA